MQQIFGNLTNNKKYPMIRYNVSWGYISACKIVSCREIILYVDKNSILLIIANICVEISDKLLWVNGNNFLNKNRLYHR